MQMIVVGYPRNMNGTLGERAEKCAAFAQQLQAMVPIPVELWDERATTVQAHNYLNETNTRGKKRKQVVDQVAATIILESYLAYRKNQQKESEEGETVLEVRIFRNSSVRKGLTKTVSSIIFG